MEMFKLKIMIPVSFTGFTGYFIYDPHISPGIILTTSGIFFLAVASSVLNQVQEADTDLLMRRTKNRPIPSGKITRNKALLISLISIIAGVIMVYEGGNSGALLIALFTMLWYNGVYTPLKRKTPYAVIPGALTGALPPIIGWVAAGGYSLSMHILPFSFLLFLVQIPHFWIFILSYGEEYVAAGIPNITESMSQAAIRILVFSLVVASALVSLILYPTGSILNEWVAGILIISSLVFVWRFSHFLGIEKEKCSRYSMLLDLYMLLVMILMITDKIIQNTVILS
jgi:protoheme IX farnesyltransferase